ncbi:peptidoglycan glycosyltransferase FtsI [Rodentibacter pneumotropicus]|uniref:Peptidoglycan D,D-transpeptidase FtsI n=1 Tax=Rodentibacter pneumotropicus TaxID=758 RepID=A0A1V3K0G6_9PAST|nr:peptidoglycan glycosyltransferase FtsI [Rodentibacter pneumotropicus]MCQ9121155.1 peptidoglycan glycosyltransferase FtsI [Rodentibacter pneumotropicus]MDC2825800.1 peptidoglycan glycosyltransferase FtsI [Rodentibacter pneumotropicus]OOF66524.1 peptidoglycan synthase [Rodentibacter pneumotropicus]THA00028.1 peptidoglycan glycosyltransferase FtsI [Rodentibacter pneumotropicus]THA00273.1 peptidoglycan glycosyltransferase FtsI [Rodentibacter pneumotropicus]
MVRFNSSKKSNKSKKTIRKLVVPTTTAIKLNKPKMVFERCFIRWRYFIATGLIFLGLGALVARAAYVQAINSDILSGEADKRSLRKDEILSVRGSILDRNGQLLSVSVPMSAVIAEPKRILKEGSLDDKERIKALADVLGLSYNELVKKIEKNPKSGFLYLARQVEAGKAQYVKELKIKGISLESEPRRFYPRVEETAHLLGYTDIDGNGIEGIEKSFNALLVGKDGSRLVRKDKRGNVVEHIADQKKYDAQDVTLSIDEKLQSMVYREIKKAVTENKAESGTAVLVDVRTGEVLAMANAPSYNPNNRVGVKAELMRNRAITDVFEPGSTVKPFVVLTALQRGAAQRNEVINTGSFTVSGKEIMDVAPRPQQTLDEILINSSNRGVSRLALRMPPSALMDTYQAAGLGKATDLGLIGEQAGVLNANRKRWADIDRATVAYGYGITATPLQMARAYATLGSFGIYRPLSITKVDPPVIGQRVFSEKTTKEIVNMLEKVAIKNKRAMVEGYRVGVKTGTARKIENGHYVNKYVAFTAGVAPISDPRYALIILINDPKAGQYYGGAVSAPVFSSIMGYALRANGIAPDAEPTDKTAKRTVRLTSRKTEQNNMKQAN